MNKEEEVVIKLCEIMGVPYSHYDNHKMSKDYFPHYNLDSIPKIVVYSSHYGPYEFAVLEDMSIMTPVSRYSEQVLEFGKILMERGGMDDKKSEMMSKLREEVERIKNAEKYLKDNNCALIINDKNKKINWC